MSLRLFPLFPNSKNVLNEHLLDNFVKTFKHSTILNCRLLLLFRYTLTKYDINIENILYMFSSCI